MSEWSSDRDPVIVCAACRLQNGLIITGARHFDNTMRAVMDALYTDKETRHDMYAYADQGFIDQFGTFYSRREARKIAEKNNQLIDRAMDSDLLYSEDMY